MALLRKGEAEVGVSDADGPVGVIRAATVLDRLLDPRGQAG
jgi:hypothetical protein